MIVSLFPSVQIYFPFSLYLLPMFILFSVGFSRKREVDACALILFIQHYLICVDSVLDSVNETDRGIPTSMEFIF